MGRKRLELDDADQAQSNLAVRLDLETKKLLSIFAIAMGISEKAIAIESINAWMKTRIGEARANFLDTLAGLEEEPRK